ncbi:phosphatidylinositol 4-kinase B, partial [Phenoliferia sp. Uapishka_3]
MAKGRGGGVAGGSSLLLRLFESHFFNVHLAVEYLKTYPNSVGITHYLIRRLRSFDASEVEFYWPQLCYLVITLPTPSVALENFILERCEQDPHIAVIVGTFRIRRPEETTARADEPPRTSSHRQTLWYLQSSLSDLFSKPTSDAFTICHRIYNRVQSIIFSDPPTPSSSTSFLSPRTREKVNAPLASFVGIGILAAAIGMPTLAGVVGPVAIEQGRRIVPLERSSEVDSDEEENAEASGSGSDEDKATQGLKKLEGSGSSKSKGLRPNGKSPASSVPPKSLSASRITPGPKRRPSYIPGLPLEATPPSSLSYSSEKKLPTMPGGYLPPSPLSTPSSSPLVSRSQSRHNNPTTPPLADTPTRRRIGHPVTSTSLPATSLSVPSLPMSRSASYLVSSQSNTGSHLPKAFLSHLLLLQSSRTQLDLLRSLQDISTRLVSVPKLARLSSLRAELTVLNHGLPRGCCLGMACHGSPFPRPGATGKGRAHARIVRISPSESVVLNSADRAPFVIHVEVLEDDLDFDPDRRQNAEDLRRALSEREGTSAYGGFGKESAGPKARMSLESGLDGLGKGEGSRSTNAFADFVPSRPVTPSPNETPSPGDGDLGAPPRPKEPTEEMDLVEQLYGDVSIHDDTDLLVAPVESDLAIANRSVDEQAWARRAEEAKSDSRRTVDTAPAPTTLKAPPSAVSNGRPPLNNARPGGRSVSDRPVVSLDDYAERMRMAAIMLAQLDASQAASLGVVATGTAAAGTLVGLPVATVAGIGGVVGAGLGAVASRLTGGRRDVQAGQASTGVVAALDTSSAVEGTSSVAGAPPLHSTAATSVAISPNPNGTPTSLPSQRQRVLSPLEATSIRNRIMGEMMALEEERMERMREDGRARSGWSGTSGVEDGEVVMRAVNKDDPSGAVFRESFASKKARIRAASPYGHLASWNVISVIVKTGADLRQEQLAIQLIKVFGQIWKEESCPSWVRYFRILVTSETSGLIETITDAVSIHSIKKDAYARTAADGTHVFTSFTLYDHYIETYGSPTSPAFRAAQDNFVKSLASYSVICYLLQLKDRHNGNILVDREGHLIHIDFGFLLSNSPGSLGFEMAPFKLPQDYVDILGGFEGEKFAEFKTLFKQAFRDARKHAERIITLVELMQKDSNLPCFANGDLTSQQLRERFQLSLTQAQVEDFSDKLIINAATSTFTRLYDLFQGYSNGIL